MDTSEIIRFATYETQQAKNFPCTCQEAKWRNGVSVSITTNLGSRCKWVVSY